jgi:hypothetical protein
MACRDDNPSTLCFLFLLIRNKEMIIMNNKVKYNYDYILDFINGENGNGCKLLTTKENYKNSKIKLQIVCNCGDTYVVRFGDFLNKNQRQCPSCGVKNRTIKNIIPYSEIVNFIKKNGCILLTPEIEYENKQTLLKIKCECEKVFYSSFTRFRCKNSNKCNDCKKKLVIDKLYNRYKHYIEIESNSNCKLITDVKELKNAKQKLIIKCACGELFNLPFNHFKVQGKHICNNCTYENLSRKFRLDINYICEYINNPQTGNGCNFINGEYINNQSPLTIQCACGEIFITDFAQFVHANKKQCNKCGHLSGANTRKIDYKEIKSYIASHGDKLITSRKEYNNTSTSLEILCQCGKLYHTTFIFYKYNEIIHCNDCRKYKYRKIHLLSYEEIKQFVEIDSESNCKLSTLENDYIDTRHKINFVCSCGEIFHTSFHEFKSGYQRTCKKCSRSISKGELRIYNYLNNKGCIFETEFTFEDCKYINVLYFDFALFDNYNNLICLIEYDGEQHFRPVNFNGITDKALSSHEATVLRDKIKNQYCKDNNIKLIRIPYWQFKKTEQILDKHLKINISEDSL